jgi:uncharacterized membrane protein YhaH (DUF805 family)
VTAQPVPAIAPAPSAVPLSQPLYGATFGQAIGRYFRKYAVFSGRASLSEYWWVALLQAIISIVIFVVAVVVGAAGVTIDPNTGVAHMGPGYGIVVAISTVWSLATLLPSLGLAWRRLHDGNRPGPLWFLVLIPFLGALLVLIFMLFNSDPAGARFDRP